MLGVGLVEVRDKLELTDANHVELKAALEQFTLNLVCDAIKADMALGYYRAGCNIGGCHCKARLRRFDEDSEATRDSMGRGW